MNAGSVERAAAWTNVAPDQVPAGSRRLVDVRSLDEFVSERLEGAECVPLDQLLQVAAGWDRREPLLLLCKSGMRAGEAARRLNSAGFSQVGVVEGGLDACKRAGLGIIAEGRRPPLFRQVMIGAGLVLLTGLGLSLVYPWFIALTWFAASMLVIAGLTGFCPMALILGRMPWNALVAQGSSAGSGGARTAESRSNKPLGSCCTGD